MELPKREIKYLPVSSLKPAPKNPKRHPKNQIDMLIKAINKFGFTNPILVVKDNVIAAGHARLEAAKKIGMAEVPTIFIDIPLEEVPALLLSDNRLAELAETDELIIAEMLKDTLEIPDFDIEVTGYTFNDYDQFLNSSENGSEEEAEEEAEKAKKEYLNLEREGITIFHALSGDQIGMIDFFHFLCAYNNESVKIQEHYPKNSLLFIDSGALTGVIKEGISYLSLETQRNIVEFAELKKASWVSMLDVPMIQTVLDALNMDHSEAYKIHLRNARAFNEIHTLVRKVYVIQGPGFADFKQCCIDMKELVTDNDVVAIGSIKNRAVDSETIEKITALVHSYFPNNDIHLFGVTSPLTVAKCVLVGATSCDSAGASYCARTGSTSTIERNDSGDFMVKRVPLEEYCQVDYSISQTRSLHTGIVVNSMLNTVLAIQLQIKKQKALHESN
jgi:hypothetical protein